MKKKCIAIVLLMIFCCTTLCGCGEIFFLTLIGLSTDCLSSTWELTDDDFVRLDSNVCFQHLVLEEVVYPNVQVIGMWESKSESEDVWKRAVELRRVDGRPNFPGKTELTEEEKTMGDYIFFDVVREYDVTTRWGRFCYSLKKVFNLGDKHPSPFKATNIRGILIDEGEKLLESDYKPIKLKYMVIVNSKYEYYYTVNYPE